MRSSRPVNRATRQRGFGLVEVLVSIGLLAVAGVVLLGSLSTVLVGAHTAERRTVEERLARNKIEDLMARRAADTPCGRDRGKSNGYEVDTLVECLPAGYLKLTVTVIEPGSKGSLSLTVDRARLP